MPVGLIPPGGDGDTALDLESRGLDSSPCLYAFVLPICLWVSGSGGGGEPHSPSPPSTLEPTSHPGIALTDLGPQARPLHVTQLPNSRERLRVGCCPGPAGKGGAVVRNCSLCVPLTLRAAIKTKGTLLPQPEGTGSWNHPPPTQ